MSRAEQLNGCCSVVELSEFGWNNEQTKEELIKTLKEFYKDYVEYDFTPEIPTTFIATTKTTQDAAEKILKDMGFRGKKFCSRHAKNSREKVLTFWIKTCLPIEIKKYITQLKKEKDFD